MKELLKEGFSQLNILFTDEIYQKLQFFTEELLLWNEKTNLTAIKTREDIAIKHYIDSLTIYPLINKQKSLIDIGTGAGFPGIILKIVGYEGKIVLLDSLKKRISFLDYIIKELNIENIETIHSRAEDGSRNKQLREQFDYATARAVAPLNILCEYCLPYVKTGGQFLAMKANKTENAKKAIGILGGSLNKIKKIILPGSDYERNIIIINKIKKTPKLYPRKAGTPAKKPL
ncbi:MAG: 16S rRNA (guanine(527)-N(7))-methyltransferase RsmG [Clostridiales bacterium]|nr:16S rRNA (guanine(527)-N(7))-methyltransferase RsmG [Clostridiales bacterium]